MASENLMEVTESPTSRNPHMIPGGFLELQRHVKPTLSPQLPYPWSAALITLPANRLMFHPKMVLDGPLSLSVAYPCLASSTCF